MMSTFLTVILRVFPFIFISIIIRCVYVNDKSHAEFVCGLILDNVLSLDYFFIKC